MGRIFIQTITSTGAGAVYIDDVTMTELPGYEVFGETTKLRQKFTPEENDPIKRVELSLARDKVNSDNVIVEILDESLNQIKNITITGPANFTPSWYIANFTTAVPVTAYKDYYIQLSSTGYYRWYANYE